MWRKLSLLFIFCFHLAISAAAAQDITSGLEGHWTFDEGTGSSAADSSGNNNAGTLNGASWIADGKVDGCLEFDGVNDYVDLGNPANMNFAGNITMSAWVKIHDYNESYPQENILSHGQDEVLDLDTVIRITSAGGYGASSWSPGEGVAYAVPSGDQDNWVHLTGIYDGTNWLLYRNGVVVDSSPGTYGARIISNYGWAIGARGGGGERYLDGLIDDVRLYSRGLSATDVLVLYNTGNASTSQIYLSTSGSATIGAQSFDDEDIVQFQLDTNTPTLQFEGDLEFSTDEDTNAIQVFSDGRILLSTPESATLGGISFNDEDIVEYDPNTSTATLIFDGSAIFSGDEDVDAAHRKADGKILLSTDAAATIGVLSFEDEDIVEYDPGTGAATLYFDGSAVFAGDEDIDAVHLMDNGNLLISTSDNCTIGGHDFGDDDVIEYNPGTGTAEMYFDGGANFSSSDEDVDAFSLVSNAVIESQWRLDETSGTTAVDSGPSGNDGAYSGGYSLAQQEPFPRYGATAEFDGTSGHVDLGTVSADFSQGITISVWARPTAANYWARFVELGNGITNDNIIFARANTYETLALHIFDGSLGEDRERLEVTGVIELNKWQHLVATIDSAGLATLYKNGQAVGSGMIGVPSSATRSECYIGRSNWSTDNYYQGGMADVRLYNRALSPSEIADLYGLLGHWTFDEGSGTTIADSSLKANDASFNTGTPAWTNGVYGNAIEFDGTNDAITGSNFEPPNKGAVAFWFRSDGTPASRQRPWGLGADFEVWQDSDGLMSMDVSTDGFQGGFITTTPVDKAGHWYHVVAQFDADDESYEIYLNGELHKSGTSTWAIVQQAANQLSFGTRTGSTQRFSGALDDLRIYNRWLSPSDISDLYGLIGHWKMDEGAGTLAADSTGFGNDATINGATWTTDCFGTYGLEFDGLGDTAATLSNFTPPDVGTVSFWMRGANTPTARGRLFGVNGNWEARQETDGSVSFDLGASPYVGNEPFASPVVDDNNRWYHIVATYDVSDDSYAVYVNGVLEASGISPVNLVSQAAGILSFGTRTGSTEYWEGAMRDFRVYNRPLMDSEISEMAGIIAHWKLDETSGIVAVDASTAGNDATYVGNPTLGIAGAFPNKTLFGVELNGSTQSITSDASLLNDLTAFTIAGWIRPDSTTPDRSLIGQNGLIELGIDYALNQIDLWTDTGGSVSATTYLPPGKWSHVIATGDGTNLKIYVNGNEVASGGSATASYGNNTDVTKIGEGVLDATGDYYDGRLDDILIYSRAVCAEEARGLYKGGRPAGVRIIRWVEVR